MRRGGVTAGGWGVVVTGGGLTGAAAVTLQVASGQRNRFWSTLHHGSGRLGNDQ